MKSNETAHVLTFPHQIESAGVDWITASAPRTRASENLYTYGQRIVEDEASNGNDMQPWRWQGYRGLKCGGASVGLRGDGYLVQLRSDVARDNWQSIMPHVANVSRIDLQLTARLEAARAELIRSQYARLRRGRRLRGRPLDATLIDSKSRGSSLYLGRRSSEQFARMYDKGGEERTAPAGTLLRWEVEYKKKTARQMAIELGRADAVDAVAAATVSQYFRSRGVQSPAFAVEALATPRPPQSSDDEARLSYLRAVIAPMLGKLLKAYSVDELLQAVGLDEASIKNRDEFK